MGSSWSVPNPNPMKRKYVPLPDAKQYVFWFHLNKPATREALKQKKGVPVWTLHYRGVCHLVESIKCLAQTETKANKHQPIAVVSGKASNIWIHKLISGSKEAWIYA